jgi:hypothetical protein
MKQIITDGDGKPDNLRENDMDCTVRAIANASGIGYPTAYILMEQAGRKPGGSAFVTSGFAEFRREGFGRFKPLHDLSWRRKMTVKQFVDMYPSGRFVLRVRGSHRKIAHVIAIVDGVYFDNCPAKPRKEVLNAWNLEAL